MGEADFIGSDDVNQTVNGSIASNRWAIQLSSTRKRALFAMSSWLMPLRCLDLKCSSFARRDLGLVVESPIVRN